MGAIRPAPIALAAFVAVAACSDSPTGPSSNLDVEVGELNVEDIPTYSGSRGLIVDTREIVRQGYEPVEVRLAFATLDGLDTVLTVDPRTNLAILSVENDSLTQEEQDALADGVPTVITVLDSESTMLAQLDADQVLDASNRPVKVFTALPRLLPALVVDPTMTFLLQGENKRGIITHVEMAFGGVLYDRYLQNEPYPDTTSSDAAPTDNGELRTNPHGQEVYFAPVSDSTYLVRHQYVDPGGEDVGTSGGGDEIWCITDVAAAVGFDAVQMVDSLDATCLQPVEVQFERNGPNWVRLKVYNGLSQTTQYLRWRRASTTYPDIGLMALDPEGDNYRLLAPRIDWDVQDRGTSFNQPVRPPARVTFAYQSTIRNCSPLEVTDVIGRTQTRRVTSTVATNESLALFGSLQLSMKVTTEAKVSYAPGGVGVEAGTSLELGATATASVTRTTQTALTSEQVEEVVVSRERTVVVPPFAGVTASDIVRSVDNVRTPWTQGLRISATHDGRPLSGSEIVTHLGFNFFGGIIARTDASFVDATVRGESVVDQSLQAETYLAEITDPCR